MPQKSKQPSSFIPTSHSGSSRVSKKSENRLSFSMVSIIIFLCVVFVWVGLLSYQYIIQDHITEKKSLLNKEKEPIFKNNSPIGELAQWDARIKSINSVLQGHLAPTVIFSFLEDVTVDGLRFSSFSYTGTPTDEIVIELSGEAHNFASILKQRDVFRESSFVNSVSFDLPEKERVQQNANGAVLGSNNVTFSAQLSISPDSVSYIRLNRPNIDKSDAVQQRSEIQQDTSLEETTETDDSEEERSDDSIDSDE